MSDDRDETRPFAPSADATRPDAAKRADATPAVDPRVDDATQLDLPRIGDATEAELPRVGADRPAELDATQAGLPPIDDATRIDAAAAGTVAQPGPTPPVRRPRPDATSVMPAADDWAPGRGNPAWTGRAEVRAPRPGGATYTEQDEWAAPVIREPRDRWWMPILVGIIALLLLTALGFGIYLIVQNSGGDGSPAPVASTPGTPARTATATTAPTTAPTTEPTPEPSTTEPTTTEVTIPALVGLSLPEAQAALARTGLSSYKLIYRDNDAPPGTVIGSDPAEGQEVPPDTAVTLVVARPSSTAPTTATPTGSTSQPGTDGD